MLQYHTCMNFQCNLKPKQDKRKSKFRILKLWHPLLLPETSKSVAYHPPLFPAPINDPKHNNDSHTEYVDAKT